MENHKESTKVFARLSADLFKVGMMAYVSHIATTFDLDETKVLEATKSFNPKAIYPTKKNKRTRADGAPERSKTAYIFFSTEIRPTLKGEDGETLDFAKAGKVIGEKWRALSDSERARFNKMAKDDRTRYEKQMAEFDPSYRPKNGGKKEDRSDIDKHRDGLKSAKDKSSGDVVYCYNLSSSRSIRYQSDKPGDKVWNAELNLCASTQEELDDWIKKLGLKTKSVKVTKKVEKDDMSDLSDDDEEEEETKPKKNAKTGKKGGKK